MLKNFHFLYKILNATKRTILIGHFGYASECNHNPPCSDYFVQQVENKGWLKGSFKGIKRFLSCW